MYVHRPTVNVCSSIVLIHKINMNGGSYLLCCFDAYNVDAVVHEIDQFWVLQMMASIVEDIEAISVTVFIFISPATANNSSWNGCGFSKKTQQLSMIIQCFIIELQKLIFLCNYFMCTYLFLRIFLPFAFILYCGIIRYSRIHYFRKDC